MSKKTKTDPRKAITIGCVPCEDGGFHLTTRGLARFGHLEMTLWAPGYLISGAADVLNERADSIINRGAVYRDGDTGSDVSVPGVAFAYVEHDENTIAIVDIHADQHQEILGSRRVVWDHSVGGDDGEES